MKNEKALLKSSLWNLKMKNPFWIGYTHLQTVHIKKKKHFFRLNIEASTTLRTMNWEISSTDILVENFVPFYFKFPPSLASHKIICYSQFIHCFQFLFEQQQDERYILETGKEENFGIITRRFRFYVSVF